MYICTKCNNTSDEAINFCPLCGNQMQEVVLNSVAPVAPTYTAPETTTYVAPEMYYTPAPVQKPSLAKKIVGMSLSIFCFVLAVLTIVYASLFAVINEDATAIASLIFTVYMSLFTLPGSIIGLVFSNGARNLGDTSKMSGVGKGLGLAGIIIIAVSYAISICAFAGQI